MVNEKSTQSKKHSTLHNITKQFSRCDRFLRIFACDFLAVSVTVVVIAVVVVVTGTKKIVIITIFLFFVWLFLLWKAKVTVNVCIAQRFYSPLSYLLNQKKTNASHFLSVTSSWAVLCLLLLAV